MRGNLQTLSPGLTNRKLSKVDIKGENIKADLSDRTIGIARATTKIGMANLVVYNIKCFIFLRKIAIA